MFARIGALISILMIVPQVTLKDQVVGTSHFKVERSGNHGEFISLLPLMTPMLKLHRLSEVGELPNEIVTCEVISRPTTVDTESDKIFTITVLRCNKIEYGVEEIDFVKDTVSHENTMPQLEGAVPKP